MTPNYAYEELSSVIIDTDPGVDDALALVFAAKSGLFDIKAVTIVAGNCAASQGAANASRILEIAFGSSNDRENRIPPVHLGAVEPLSGTHEDAIHVHGDDGLGGIESLLDDGRSRYPAPAPSLSPGHAADIILEIADRHPGKISIITLGPLTNVALAARRDYKALSKARQIVSMAGAFRAPGNVTPVAEYNAWADPDACQEVLEFIERTRDDPGCDSPRLCFVGLDVTHQAILLRRQLQEWIETKRKKIAARDDDENPRTAIERADFLRLSQFLADCTDSIMRFHRETRGFDGMYLHDPLAVMLTAYPYLAATERVSLSVERNGALTRGMTIADLRGERIPPVGIPAEIYASVNAEETLAVFRKGLIDYPIA